MSYVLLFLPSIVAVIALCISLIYGRNKSALIIASVAAMAAFLLAKDTLSTVTAVNAVVMVFALVYLVISIVSALKKRDEDKE